MTLNFRLDLWPSESNYPRNHQNDGTANDNALLFYYLFIFGTPNM